eukprot:749092-Hanusia_phi.AAC.6
MFDYTLISASTGTVTSSPNLTDLLDGVSGAAIQYAGKISVCGEAPPQVGRGLDAYRCDQALKEYNLTNILSRRTSKTSAL